MEPSKATVYEWVRDYTDKAMAEMKGHKAQTGGHWAADEMMVDVGGQKMWLWNVIDEETRYILASHLTPRRDANAARVVLRKAALAAAAPPKTIKTDKLKSYGAAVKDVLPETKHTLSQGLWEDINNNLSERLQGTFRDRIKTLRGLDSRKTGQRYLDGWVFTYNQFRGHESLNDDTPSKRAKVNPPFKEWANVVKAGAASPPGGEGGDAASLAIETEIATAGSRRGRAPGKKAAKRGRPRRKKAPGQKAVKGGRAKAGVPQGAGESTEAQDRAAVGAGKAEATQQALDFAAAQGKGKLSQPLQANGTLSAEADRPGDHGRKAAGTHDTSGMTRK